ncbi:ubiquitin-like protease family profile domain-containing protein [Pseudoscourfieldia marina]
MEEVKVKKEECKLCEERRKEETSKRGIRRRRGTSGHASAAATAQQQQEEEEQTELEDEILRDFEHQDDVARERYLDAINANNGVEIMCSHIRDRLDLTRRDLSTLNKQGWLNDEVINCYVALLQDRDLAWRRDGDPGGRRRPRCHFFNTLFYNKLFQDSHKYSYLERWTRAKKLAKVHGGKTLFDSCDKIIAPIHKGNHWCCAVIDLEAQAFVYYDSFKSEDHDCLQAMKQFAIDEARTRENTHINDVESWPVVFPHDIPEQRNG